MTSTMTDRIDGPQSALAMKAPCRVATSSNITLSGEQTIDGVTTDEDRVLVMNQTDASENGIYDTSTSSWTRAKDFDGSRDVTRGTMVFVYAGSTNSGFYQLTTDDPTIDTDDLTFAETLVGDSSTLTFTPADTESVARTIQSKLRDARSIKDFGAVGDGTTDDTAAIQNALETGGSLYAPAGTYKVTSTLTFSLSGTYLWGDGLASIFSFVPTTTDVLFDVTAGATEISCCGIVGLLITGSNSQVKTAIAARDIDRLTIERVQISTWNGTGSIGLNTFGRQLLYVRDLTIYADKPIVISKNANASAHALGLDSDHFHWQDIYLVANGNPCWTVDDGVSMTNCRWDGAQAWVMGTHGFYWVDSTSVISSYKLSFIGVRREQSTDATAETFHIALSGSNTLQELDIDDCYADPNQDGYYFRGVERLILQHSTYNGSGTAIDMTAGSQSTYLGLNNFWSASGTRTLTSFFKHFGVRCTSNARPTEVEYYSAQAGGVQTGIVATASIPSAGTYMDGSLIIEDSGTGTAGLYAYKNAERHSIPLQSQVRAAKLRYATVPIGGVNYGSLGTSTTPVAGTIYSAEVRIDEAKTLTGVGILNGSTVGTNKYVVGLYGSTGNLLIQSSTAGALTAGSSSFQNVAFTSAYIAGAGRYWIGVQLDGATDRFKTIATNTYLDVLTKASSGTFGSLGSLTLPSTFTADAGPIAYVY